MRQGVAVNVKLKDRVDGFWRRLSFRLMPGRCVLCAATSDRAVDLCIECEVALPWNTACCGHCALPLTANETRCGRCQKSAPQFDAAYCAFRYAWPLDGVVTRFKFSGDLAAGRVLSHLLAQRLHERLLGAANRPQMIVPVPLHRERLRERGFNQALELARPLAAALRIPLLPEALRRTRATPKQSDLDGLHRRRNVRGAFAVDADVHGLHVAIVDDVITTAATVRECAKALKRAGAATVQVWAVARAPIGPR